MMERWVKGRVGKSVVGSGGMRDMELKKEEDGRMERMGAGERRMGWRWGCEERRGRRGMSGGEKAQDGQGESIGSYMGVLWRDERTAEDCVE